MILWAPEISTEALHIYSPDCGAPIKIPQIVLDINNLRFQKSTACIIKKTY